MCTIASSLPVGIGWPWVTTSDEPTSTLNGVLNELMIATRSLRPVAVNSSCSGRSVTQCGGIEAILPIGLIDVSVGSGFTADIGATYTIISGVATLSVLLVTS